MNDDRARSFLVSKRVFGLDAEDIDTLYPWLAQRKCSPGETVFSEGAEGGSAYIVYSGRVQLVRFGWVVHVYEAGDIFGEVSLLDHKERTGTVTAVDDVSLFSLSDACLDDPDFPGRIAAKLYRAMGRKVSGYARAGTDFYRTMDVLLLQDGGCAPGYNTVTAFLSDYLEKDDRKVFIAKEGFKSLVTGNNFDFGALISSPKVFETFDHVPGVVFAPPLRDQRGAAFRTERYPEFKAESNQRKAAELIVSKRVRVIVGVGGDGTLAGLQALVPKIPREVQCFFVPVTIDSDIFGTECIGQHTGVEMGAEKVRGYLADSLTHHRCYIIEMMGANGGYHALHSCIGAGAHLAVLPGSTIDVGKLARAIGQRKNTVIVVAEGYKRPERKKKGLTSSASDYLYRELLDAGLDPGKKVVCEPFSRDIRGAAPNNLDVMLSQQMAKKVAHMVREHLTCWMPAVESGKVSALHFDQITTDNSVGCQLAELGNRIEV